MTIEDPTREARGMLTGCLIMVGSAVLGIIVALVLRFFGAS